MARTSGAGQANEGEGNKTAAREFNDAQRRFVKSGQVAEKACEAERALDGPERGELEAAEAAGKSHAVGEDPLVATGSNSDPNEEAVRRRAHEIWEAEGRPSGKEHDHWQQAEREVRGRPT